MGAQKGRIPWNKGLNKETDKRIKKYGEKGRKAKIGNRNASKHKIGEIWKPTNYLYLVISTIKGRIDLHRYTWEKYNGKIPTGYLIHHKDNDRLNNEIKNLEIMEKSAHNSLHNKGRHRTQSLETKIKISKSLRAHKVSNETKRKISDGLKFYWMNKK